MKTSLTSHIAGAKRECTSQFLSNRFVIGAHGKGHLLQFTHAHRYEKVSGFSESDGGILIYHNNKMETYVDPTLSNYRDFHKACLERMGVQYKDSDLALFDSDHVYAKSAAVGQVELVRLNLIERSTNRHYGAAWEKRFTHDHPDSPIKTGELVALLKSLGVPMSNPRDPVASLKSAVDQLIALGYAIPGDRAFLLKRADDCMEDKQAQDTRYATEDTRQVDLRDGYPLIPKNE